VQPRLNLRLISFYSIQACFFVSSVSQENADFKSSFSSMGIAHQLLFILQREDHEQTHEHVAKALLTILTDNQVPML
jgi:hypothetical protein